jgi:toxin-antitoxin system PIN domain toxin
MSQRRGSKASGSRASEPVAAWGRPAVLLDVNVLVALAWPNHVHHGAALDWFNTLGKQRFATCPVTQSGFVRVSSNRRAIAEARTPREACGLLRRIVKLPGHVFWTDEVDLSSTTHIAWERLGTHAQVTDAHLLALALHHGGRLATFDREIVNLVPGAAGAVVLVPA